MNTFVKSLIIIANLAAQSFATDLMSMKSVDNQYLKYVARQGKSYGTTKEF
jgi:hypothetical protein